MIEGVQSEYPDAIFLSEAFTKPKMMKALAKAGFTQSYSYFTWRNNKAELIEYFTELTQTEMKDYYRANLFPNTPDILPFFLQNGGRPGFMIRATLAATLSSVYGIYSGFELCENAALPGREEYYDSENTSSKAAIGTRLATSRSTSPGSTAPGARTARCKGTITCASCPATTTRFFST